MMDGDETYESLVLKAEQPRFAKEDVGIELERDSHS
jgi:hypothetical protein